MFYMSFSNRSPARARGDTSRSGEETPSWFSVVRANVPHTTAKRVRNSVLVPATGLRRASARTSSVEILRVSKKRAEYPAGEPLNQPPTMADSEPDVAVRGFLMDRHERPLGV